MALRSKEFLDIIKNILFDLNKMSRGQLHVVFNEVFRAYRRINHDVAVVDDAVCIASVAAELNDDLPYVTCWGFPESSGDSVVYDDYDGGSLLSAANTGRCERCKVDVVCTEKLAICPVCDFTVECT